MRRLILALSLLSSTALPTLAEKRVALVFGQDKYELIRPLENASNDAEAVEEALDELGFDVSLETNRDLKRMRRALEDFKEDAEGADVALVYFAGHGVEIAGENRLLPTDADAATLDTLKDTSLPLEEVRQMVAEIGKVGLVLLDACRNDPFGGAGGEAGRGAVAMSPTVSVEVKPGLGRLGKAENLLYTFSAAPGATAADGSGENSPFTSALVKYLATDGLEIRSVMTLVQQEVYDLSRGGQLPYVENGLPKLFFASTQSTDLPERERLLLAMADVTTDLRDEVERLAAEKDMPLAPLYGALISSDAKALSVEDRRKKLTEAADAFVATRDQIRTMASSDPAVEKLREEAEMQLALGAFDTARGKLTEAAGIDSRSREALKDNFVERTASEASTHIIAGGASRTSLKYDLAIESYAKAAALFDEVEKDLPATQRQDQLKALDTLGEIFITVGRLDDARAAYERGRASAQRAVEVEPDNPVWTAALAKSFYALAGVTTDLGDSGGALQAYQKSLALRQQRLRVAPDDRAAQAGSADALLRIGGIHVVQGRIDDGIAAFEESRDILLRLTASGKPEDDWLRSLSTAHIRVSERQLSRYDYAGSLASAQAARDIAADLTARLPNDARQANALAGAYDAIGDARLKLKDIEGTLAAYSESLKISEALAGADPTNATWQRNLSLSLEQLGDAMFEQNTGQRDAAVKLYQRALDLRLALSRRDAKNALWQSDLAFAYDKLGGMMTAIFDDEAAIDYYKQALVANERLSALDPANVDSQRGVLFSLRRVGWSLWQLKRWDEGHQFLDRRLAFALKIQAARPDSAMLRGDVYTALTEIADMRNREVKDSPAAIAAYEQASAKAKEFAAANPQNFFDVNRVASAGVSLGDAYPWSAHYDKALAAYRDAALWIDKAIALKPDDAPAWRQKSLIGNRIGGMLGARDDIEGAIAAYESGIVAIDRAIALDPANADYANDRAFGLGRMEEVRGKLQTAETP